MAMAHITGSERRKARVRRALKARAKGRPRLSVFRSDKNIYAQIIDDATGRTLAAASTIDKDVKASVQGLRRSFSTAAAISITAASRRWPMRPAKAD
jgi:large subunit ribosomal protein L18